MRKKVWAIVLAVVLAVSALACLIPWPRAISHQLTAVKLDSNGHPIGTVPLTLEGIKTQSIFRSKPVEIYVPSFDGQKALSPSPFGHMYGEGWYEVVSNQVFIPWGDAEGASRRVVLRVDEALDLWFISIAPGDGEKVYYVACASGCHSQEELVEIFRTRILSDWKYI